MAPAGVADVRLTCGNPGGQASRPDALVARLEEKGPLGANAQIVCIPGVGLKVPWAPVGHRVGTRHNRSTLAVSGRRSEAFVSRLAAYERWPMRPTVGGRLVEKKSMEFQWVGAP